MKPIEIFAWERTREFVALPEQQDKIFIFGDNTVDRLNGYIARKTQAVIRWLPNTFGIDTKKNRFKTDDSYFTNDDLPSYKVYIDTCLQTLQQKAETQTLVFPAWWIGTWRAMLREKAPLLLDYLNTQLFDIFGFKNEKRDG